MVGIKANGERQFALCCFAEKVSARKAREHFKKVMGPDFVKVSIIDTELDPAQNIAPQNAASN